jgi:hypothetical protein
VVANAIVRLVSEIDYERIERLKEIWRRILELERELEIIERRRLERWEKLEEELQKEKARK